MSDGISIDGWKVSEPYFQFALHASTFSQLTSQKDAPYSIAVSTGEQLRRAIVAGTSNCGSGTTSERTIPMPACGQFHNRTREALRRRM